MAIIVTLASNGGGLEPGGLFIEQSDGAELFITVQNQSASPVTVTGLAVFAVPAFAPVLIGQPQLPMGGVSIPGSSTVTLAQTVSVSGLRPQYLGQTATSPAPPSFVAYVSVSDGSSASSPPVTLSVTPALLNAPNALGYTNSQLLPGSTVNYQYYNPNQNGTLRYDGYDTFAYIFPGVALGLF
jgi:hypothetical protein